MQKSPVFGVIGTGTIGRIHLQALQSCGFKVGAIAEPSAPARTAALALAPDAIQYNDWKDLLRDPAITAVQICTINSMHYEILKAAIASGKNVFCEKTMTVDAQQAMEALTLKLRPGQVVQIGYMKRFFPSSQWAKEQLERIGEPICATIRTFQSSSADVDIYDSNDWRPTTEGPSRVRLFASGGMLNMAGSHMLDMTAWLLGTPQSIYCHTWSPKGYDADLHTHALFKMESGAIVYFEAALSPFSKTGTYENGWDESIQIDGRKGRLELYYPLWDRSVDYSARARIYLEEEKKWEEPIFPRVNAFHVELKAFEENCRTGKASEPSIQEGSVVDCWIDACYRSAESGREENFPLASCMSER
ncbi:MAG: Gfo/Idh/MocA family protein [Candidatus Methylacidiphilales bacterium]